MSGRRTLLAHQDRPEPPGETMGPGDQAGQLPGARGPGGTRAGEAFEGAAMRARWKPGYSRHIREQKALSTIKKYTKREAQFLMVICAMLGFLIGLLI